MRLESGCAHADGQIVTFSDEVDVAIAQVDVDLHLGIAAAKLRHQRQDAVVPIGGGQADAQRPRGFLLLAADRALRLDQLGQRLAALLVVATATFGQANAAGRAQEQSGAQAFLQPADRATDRRRRHARGQPCRGETAQLGSEAEQFDAAKQYIVELAWHD